MSGDGKKTRHTFPRRLRLIKTADFGVVVRTRNEHTFRSDAVFFSAQCMRRPEAPGELRFGVTVGKKNAKRAVDRALVKRILRESARMQAPALLTMLGQRGLGLDVSLRLKTPLAQAGDRTACAQARAPCGCRQAHGRNLPPGAQDPRGGAQSRSR